MHARRNPLLFLVFSCFFMMFNCTCTHTWCYATCRSPAHEMHDSCPWPVSSRLSELVLPTNVTHVQSHENNNEFRMGLQISWNSYFCCSKWQQCLYDHDWSWIHKLTKEWMAGLQRTKMWVSIKSGVHLGDMSTSSRLNSQHVAKGTNCRKHWARGQNALVPLKSPTANNKTLTARSHNIPERLKLMYPQIQLIIIMFPIKNSHCRVLGIIWLKH